MLTGGSVENAPRSRSGTNASTPFPQPRRRELEFHSSETRMNQPRKISKTTSMQRSEEAKQQRTRKKSQTRPQKKDNGTEESTEKDKVIRKVRKRAVTIEKMLGV
ncbi:hypothetical protein BDY24DRAFT_375115 [Mrakia frigida]|uniref:uncharacterized protein n=1 Tax=Mrakia frigida TaxID=29902 RepID=UPI003FCC03B4